MAASDTTLKSLAVFLAISKRPLPKLSNCEREVPRKVFNSVSSLFKEIVALAAPEIPLLIPVKTPAIAPKAVTLAAAACNDLENSAASPLILPNG